MDDALYAKKKENGDFELTIAIADPTAYISPDDAMDKVARERGFTIYLLAATFQCCLVIWLTTYVH